MSNLINVQQIEGDLLVSSREIATNFEKRHNDVVKTIENLTTENFVVKKMFIESTFEHKGNFYKEYLMNRDGFSLLVMGFTGSKAMDWKLKYIDAFNKMEQELRNPYQKLSPELQAIFSLDAKTQELENKVLSIENKMTINYELAENLRTSINRRTVELLGGKDSEAYKKLNKKLFAAFYRDIKRTFKVNSYKNLSIKNYDIAIKFVEIWEPNDEVLSYAIQGLNSQIKFA